MITMNYVITHISQIVPYILLELFHLEKLFITRGVHEMFYHMGVQKQTRSIKLKCNESNDDTRES